jgi:hypothetical protein
VRLAPSVLAVLILAACGGGVVRSPDIPPVAGRFATTVLPPMQRFADAGGGPSRRSNNEIAQDFLDLSFRLETGRPLVAFSRFDGPMTLRMQGAVPATARRDLDQLMARLRSEAGLPVTLAQGSAPAAITIEFLPRRKLQARARDAACFVAPRVSSWAEYRRAGRAQLDWTDDTRRTKAAIFIPSDTSPQEVRDCLHEELAQTLGPLNDLFRLPDSIFNDDNMVGVLTGFDMLILRATYAPDLQPGMSEAEVSARLPAILARLNPGGAFAGSPVPPTPRAYGDAIARALGPDSSPPRRRAGAEDALALSQPWQDGRTAFAWLTLGRVAGRGEAEMARAAFGNASALYHARGLAIHAAHADLQLAMFLLTQGDWQRAVDLCDEALGPARTGRNASLLAGLLMVKAAAMERMGATDAAARVRLDSLGWARYGMTSDAEVRRRLTLIDALANEAGKPNP